MKIITVIMKKLNGMINILKLLAMMMIMIMPHAQGVLR